MGVWLGGRADRRNFRPRRPTCRLRTPERAGQGGSGRLELRLAPPVHGPVTTPDARATDGGNA
jgi:hypothetical protein